MDSLRAKFTAAQEAKGPALNSGPPTLRYKDPATNKDLTNYDVVKEAIEACKPTEDDLTSYDVPKEAYDELKRAFEAKCEAALHHVKTLTKHLDLAEWRLFQDHERREEVSTAIVGVTTWCAF